MDINKDNLTDVENNENLPNEPETTEEKVVEPVNEETATTPVFSYNYTTNAEIGRDTHTCEHQHGNAPHMPPHPRPRHCHRHNGQPPHHGRPPMGQMPYGQPPHGQPPRGQIPYGQAPMGQNQNPYGQPPHGQPTYGQPPRGQIPYGQAPMGQNPYGQPSHGQPPHGQPPRGQMPYGQSPMGQNPYQQNQPAQPFNMYSQKNRFVAGILGVLLGGLGIHNFYLGFTTKGVIQIIVSLLTLGLASVWGFIEGILYLSGAMDKDANGIPLKD